MEAPRDPSPRRRTVACERELALPPDEVYHHWNERSCYPRFLPGVQHVELIDEEWSHWLLAGRSEPVEVEQTDNVLHHYLAWRVHDQNRERVSVWVEGPDDGPTLVRIEISWRSGLDAPPPVVQAQRAEDMLDRFRAYAESDPELSAWPAAAEPRSRGPEVADRQIRGRR